MGGTTVQEFGGIMCFPYIFEGEELGIMCFPFVFHTFLRGGGSKRAFPE